MSNTISLVKLPPLKPMTNVEIRGILQKARDYAADHWISGTLGNINQKACALGVISEAQLIDLTSHTGQVIPVPHQDDPVVKTLADAIPMQFKRMTVNEANSCLMVGDTKYTLEDYSEPSDWVVSYNDHPGRTQRTILRWFDRAILSTYSRRHQKRLVDAGWLQKRSGRNL